MDGMKLMQFDGEDKDRSIAVRDVAKHVDVVEVLHVSSSLHTYVHSIYIQHGEHTVPYTYGGVGQGNTIVVMYSVRYCNPNCTGYDVWSFIDEHKGVSQRLSCQFRISLYPLAFLHELPW